MNSDMFLMLKIQKTCQDAHYLLIQTMVTVRELAVSYNFFHWESNKHSMDNLHGFPSLQSFTETDELSSVRSGKIQCTTTAILRGKNRPLMVGETCRRWALIFYPKAKFVINSNGSQNEAGPWMVNRECYDQQRKQPTIYYIPWTSCGISIRREESTITVQSSTTNWDGGQPMGSFW